MAAGAYQRLGSFPRCWDLINKADTCADSNDCLIILSHMLSCHPARNKSIVNLKLGRNNSCHHAVHQSTRKLLLSTFYLIPPSNPGHRQISFSTASTAKSTYEISIFYMQSLSNPPSASAMLPLPTTIRTVSMHHKSKTGLSLRLSALLLPVSLTIQDHPPPNPCIHNPSNSKSRHHSPHPRKTASYPIPSHLSYPAPPPHPCAGAVVQI